MPSPSVPLRFFRFDFSGEFSLFCLQPSLPHFSSSFLLFSAVHTRSGVEEQSWRFFLVPVTSRSLSSALIPVTRPVASNLENAGILTVGSAQYFIQLSPVPYHFSFFSICANMYTLDENTYTNVEWGRSYEIVAKSLQHLLKPSARMVDNVQNRR
ncbi:uncharacterized protein LOC129312410 [Prosopis cineraria]|uniref:uncharacterized protein LOC129312410 n=1 Tax=Prosopis cineraria TaxID=364024 RepID=UPI00240FF53F|nr:uncharacterized protein LOC129312410 [Prosopis cineraria]